MQAGAAIIMLLLKIARLNYKKSGIRYFQKLLACMWTQT
jgi:hypothetical protein